MMEADKNQATAPTVFDLFNARKFAEMEALARRQIDIAPGDGDAWKALGVSLKMQGKDAFAALQRAADLLPDDALAQFNCGVALHDARELDKAINYYKRSIELAPDNTRALNNLGNIHKERRNFAAAKVAYLAALSIERNFPEAHNNLGLTNEATGDIRSAFESYKEALRLRPDYANAWNNFANLLRRMALLSDARIAYQNALKAQPDYFEAHNNLGALLRDMGEPEAALTHFSKSIALCPSFVGARSNLLLSLSYLHESRETMLLEAREYGLQVAREATPYRAWSVDPNPARQLKIGFVSGDFRTHPVGFFLDNMLGELGSSSNIKLVAYSSNGASDSLTERLQKYFHAWREVADLPIATLAAQIHADAIDILIDLSGHTAHNRLPLFAWKPAPVQASWLGYVATTGVNAIDYFIADNYAVPQTQESQFVEKVWRMPESMICFTPPEFDLPVSPPPALVNGFVTFGSFNNLTKMNDAVVTLWSQILHGVPNSKLLLNTKQLNDAVMRETTWRRFADHGIQRERVLLEYVTPRENSLAAYCRVDIALDPFPYNGGTTTAEALWMGVPVLALAGDRLVARMGVSQLANVGLADWIASDQSAYLIKAKQLADIPRLALLRAGLRRQVLASALFDAPRFARHFEVALRGMWEIWCTPPR